MQNKRGQFYIIAAVIIVIIISGLAVVSTQARTQPTPETIQSLSADLNQEAPGIVDFGIFTNKDLEKVLDNFTSQDFAPYFLQKTDNTNVVFIYGNKTDLKAVKYNTVSTGTITASLGGNIVWENFGQFAEQIDVTPTAEDKVTVKILNKNYQFTIREGEMFYFVIVQIKGDETYIKRN